MISEWTETYEWSMSTGNGDKMIDGRMVTLTEQCIYCCPWFLTFKPIMETRQTNNPDFQLGNNGVTDVEDEVSVESVQDDKDKDNESIPGELSDEEITKAEVNTTHRTNKRSAREVFSDDDTVQVSQLTKPNTKHQHQHQRVKKDEGIDTTDLNSILAGKTEAAKMKAQAQLKLAEAKLAETSIEKFQNDKELKSLDAIETAKARAHETMVALSSQSLEHWKANMTRIKTLKEFDLPISDADIAFLQAPPPDPRSMLIVPLSRQHNETDNKEDESTGEL